MPIRPITYMGEPSLTEISTPVSCFDDHLKQLVIDLKDTMKKEQGVGLAAPQIGVNQRVMIAGFEKSDRYPHVKPIPLMVFVNPDYEPANDTLIAAWEGCVSVPGFRGLVERYETVGYRAYNEKGELFEGIASGMLARIIQHEIDHLDGMLFPFRVKNLKRDLICQQVYDKLYSAA